MKKVIKWTIIIFGLLIILALIYSNDEDKKEQSSTTKEIPKKIESLITIQPPTFLPIF